MLNSSGVVIYVGKAKNLAKRLRSYFSGTKDPKTTQLIANLSDLNITVTNTETEALLLELELIKQLQPKYNIIFKDAKSYPYIKITVKDAYPQLNCVRGNTDPDAQYFGPYPNTRSAYEGVELIQKIFKLRNCDLNFFNNRQRPCLQYQIKRCSAPCVGLISQQDYGADLQKAQDFLAGKTKQIIQQLNLEMHTAAQELLYERAAILREQISALTNMQQQQIIIDPNKICNIDVLGVSHIAASTCVHVLAIRHGRILGSRQYFPKQGSPINSDHLSAILSNFILQHYAANVTANDFALPQEIVIATKIADQLSLQQALQKITNRKILIKVAKIGDRVAWLKMATTSAEAALQGYLQKMHSLATAFTELTAELGSQTMITKVASFDISHHHGSESLGACVVYNRNGPVKSEYRRYNLKTVSNGDDYLALAETLERHYIKIVAAKQELPNVVIIDGGKGQLTVAKKIIWEQLKLSNLIIIGVAKGRTRKIGNETLYLANTKGVTLLKLGANALRLLQLIRDATHDFAITGHRKQSNSRITRSKLEQISGIGSKKRTQLLQHFGSLENMTQATILEFTKISGISKKLAQRIYNELHQDPK